MKQVVKVNGVNTAMQRIQDRAGKRNEKIGEEKRRLEKKREDWRRKEKIGEDWRRWDEMK